MTSDYEAAMKALEQAVHDYTMDDSAENLADLVSARELVAGPMRRLVRALREIADPQDERDLTMIAAGALANEGIDLEDEGEL